MRRLLPALALATLLVLPACSGDDAPEAEGAAAPTEATTAVDPALAGLPGAEEATVNEEGVDPLPPLPDDVALPIVFVHGFAGSAQQYESQAVRFVANGDPQDRIVAYDHDGAGTDIGGYADGLAEVVDEALEASGAEQVYLVGHSRGTFVAGTYLADPARAVNVAKYIALDGAPCPRMVPCLAPTQESNPAKPTWRWRRRRSPSPPSTSSWSGDAPAVVDIVPQRDLAVLSAEPSTSRSTPAWRGPLDIWAVDPDTGRGRATSLTRHSPRGGRGVRDLHGRVSEVPRRAPTIGTR